VGEDRSPRPGKGSGGSAEGFPAGAPIALNFGFPSAPAGFLGRNLLAVQLRAGHRSPESQFSRLPGAAVGTV